MCMFMIQSVVVGILYTIFSNISMISPRIGGFVSVLPFISTASLISTYCMNSIGAAKVQAGCACVSSALIIGFYCAILVVIHLYNHYKASKAQESLNSSKNTNHKIIRQFFIGSIIYAMISGIALVSPRIGGYISVLPFVSGAVLVNTMLNKSMLQTEVQVAGNVWGAVITTGFFLVSWTFL